ncbi:MAG: transglutaminase-like domain-containing protein, partial [Armatimonadota bacterium]
MVLSPRSRSLLIILCRRGAPLVALLAACGRAYSADSWLGIYFGTSKIGYSHIHIRQATVNRKPGYRVLSTTVMRMALLGQPVEQRIVMDQLLDRRWNPLQLSFSMNSAGHETKLFAIFGTSTVKCKLTSAGTVSQKVLRIPKGVKLVMDPSFMLARTVTPGRKLRFHYLNAVGLAVESGTAEVLRRDTISVGGVAYKALVVKTTMPMGTMIHWQDDRGELLRAETVLGITMIKETKEQALSLPEQAIAPPVDMAAAVSVNLDRPIENPRTLRTLRLELTSKEPIPYVADARQTCRQLPATNGTHSVELTIRAEDINLASAVKLAAIPKQQYGQYLISSPYIQCSDPRIRAKAKEIVGDETNAARAALLIRDWIHQNMTYRADIGILRPAVDVLKSKVGVCRDYAVLYAALARAAGIPTRIAAGLV